MSHAKRSSGGFGFRSGAALLLGAGLAAGGCSPELPGSGSQLFTSPQANPIALSDDGEFLLVANTTSGTLSIYDLTPLVRKGRVNPRLMAQVRVGLDPVGIAQRPGSDQVWVTNYISDSISVVDLSELDVVDTIQELDAAGVTRTDAPVGVAFAGPTRAFVTLDDANQVLVIDTAPDGSNPAISDRLAITAQAPRALAVADGKLYVAAFESENGTEFPTCAPGDPRGLDESNPHDEGCEFAGEIIDRIEFKGFMPNGQPDIDIQLGTIFNFAAVNPNIGGRIIRDHDRPDRDLFVFDANTLELEQVVEHVGTLLYGVAAQGGRVWITHTDARNHLEGLAALDNRMFENRIAALDCAPSCGAPQIADLDANAFGVPVPTPYGVRASADGETLVVSVAGSDGQPGLAGDPGTDIPGLVTLDRDGQVLGHLQTGAIPQGVALASDANGAAQTAYVLNTVDSTVSVVDVSDPAHPQLVGTFGVGHDPTPDVVREGRIAFSSARASTGGEFSCESCHPNSNIDQVLWVINSVNGPNDVPGCNPFQEECPEPRTTMPIRGLRDTLPLHWMGNLADPFENHPTNQLPQPEDHAAPDCDLSTDGEVGCARHLVDGSLSGVMCDQIPSCAVGPSGLPGAFTDAERDALATFLLAVSFPPSPARQPNDVLTPLAEQGVADFFTDEDGLGVGSPTGGGIGGQVGFAPITCADNSGGCHALPLTASTNSVTVGGFDAPSMRGMWDRFVLFSNGVVSSEEWLELAQACADGNPPGGHPDVHILGSHVPPPDSAAILAGDPCALAATGFFGFTLDPFAGVPSGEHIYDPAEGMTERGQFAGTFEAIFHLAYGVRAAPMWQFLNEMSVGLPGLTGRQLVLDADSAGDPDVVAAMTQMEEAAGEGRITLVARNRAHAEYRFADGHWHTERPFAPPLTPAEFRARVTQLDATYTLTAELPENISIAGSDRQVLLDVDPDAKAEEDIGDLLAVPEPSAAGGDTIRVGAKYANPAAAVLVDGVRCGACNLTLGTAPVTGEPIADISLPMPLTPGIHVVQLLNPDGWMSNEMPILARAEESEE